MNRHDDDLWRLTVKLKSRSVLLEYMKFRKIGTAYELSRRAGLKPGVVGHLVAGRRNSCSPQTALALEEALGCPTGLLFEQRMSQIASKSRRKAAA